MNKAIGDKAAITFAASFYRALGFNRTIQEAFDQAKTALLLEGVVEEDLPELLIKKGVPPNKLISAAEPIADERAKDLIIDILGNTFRRAFSLNFTTRFVRYDEYEQVLSSIQDCHAFLQQRMVRVVVTCDKETIGLIDTMLWQLELMETVFRQMEPYARDPGGSFDEADKSADFLAGRLDGTGQPGLMRAFVDMEKVRLDFLLNTTRLAEKFGIALPEVPVTEARSVFYGAMINLESSTIEDIKQSREILVSGRRYGIKPREHPLKNNA